MRRTQVGKVLGEVAKALLGFMGASALVELDVDLVDLVDLVAVVAVLKRANMCRPVKASPRMRAILIEIQPRLAPNAVLPMSCKPLQAANGS